MNIVEILLKELKVKHSKKFIEDNYLYAPDSDNMLGIQRVLSRYNIETIGVHFHDKEEAGITFPCMLHCDKSIVVGIDIEDDTIRYYFDGKYITEEIRIFNENWTGDVLFVANCEKAKEPSYTQNRIVDFYEDFINYTPFIFIVCLVSLFWMNNNIFTSRSVNMFFDLSGVCVCILLFLKQLHANNVLADKVCSALEKKGCDSVLESEKAKILGIISWSEIGLAYFSARIIFGSLYENSLVILQMVGWLAMSYGLWSIWSQAFIVRHWCTLCCLIQVIIWGAGIYNIFSFGQFHIIYTDVVTFGVCYIVSFVFIKVIYEWHFINKKYKMLNKNFLSFKLRKNIIKTSLQESPTIKVEKEDSSIIYGNKSASVTLTILTNPHCNSCANIHKKLIHLIKENSNIKVQYIYTSFSKKVEKSSLFCVAVYQQKPYIEAIRILNDWYEYGRFHYEGFIEKYDVDIHHPDVLKEYLRHVNWQENTEIHHTPTVIYQGHRLSDYYNIEDFIYLDSEG